MKSPADYLKGLLLIMVSIITYLVCRHQKLDWDMVFEGYGKFRLLLGIVYVLFGNIWGATIGVLVGLWYIFRN